MKYILIFLGILAFLPSAALAQDSLTLTVTPPLFKINLGPGDYWASSLKVVNSNPGQQEIFARVVNFVPKGEGGRGDLVPVLEGSTEQTLAEWIEVPQAGTALPAEGSIEIPFSLRIPENASPGGHYAAILLGTEPPEKEEGSVIRVSALISTLLFVEVRGDIVEDGIIRELSTEKNIYQKPEAELTLRFENRGNVHLQPQGHITIYNMWGRERGEIPINQETQFGNVLPESIRKFEFVWKGERNFFEVGRYKAVATLAFGKEERKNITRETAFWIVPIIPIALIFGATTVAIFIVIWIIRAYIHRILQFEAEKRGIVLAKEKKMKKRRTWSIRIREKGKIIFILLAILIIGYIIQAYVGAALQKERKFEIIIPDKQEF